MSLPELRRSYWWACRFLDSMYKVIGVTEGGVTHHYGVLSEYPTRTPFTQVFYKKLDDVTLTGFHQMGCAVMADFIECVQSVNWFKFSNIHDTWWYVHSATRDYTVISRIGFEDTEPLEIVITRTGTKVPNLLGDAWADQDCNEPNILVEYSRNRLKNGFFTFRQFLDSAPENDLPAFWTVYYSESLSDAKLSLSTDSYQGPYSLKAWYKGSESETGKFFGAHQELSNILPDTEYVLSLYFKGEINSSSVIWGIYFYDVDGHWIGGKSETLDSGTYNDWTNHELRFRTPSMLHRADVFIYVFINTEPYSEATAYFDAFWLSECPVNLKPNYTLLAQVEKYDGERSVDIYFNGSRIWQSISAANVPRNVFETQVPLEGIPSFRTPIRHSVQNNVFYYKYTSMHPDWQDRANKLQAFRDKYEYTCDIYHPLWRESDSYGDFFMVSRESVHDCSEVDGIMMWYYEPRTLTFYPYWSKICQCPSLAVSPVCGYLIANVGRLSLIMHLLNKYQDPYKMVTLPVTTCPVETLPTAETSALQLLNAIDGTIDPDKGSHEDPVKTYLYDPFTSGYALAAYAEMGYGFGAVLEAHGDGGYATYFKDKADRLAQAVLKMQWGYPFQAGKIGYYKNDVTGEVCIPEYTGGFCTAIKYINGEPYDTGEVSTPGEILDFFGINMPPETPGMIAVNQESTFICLRGLQIYEWYKYKNGKGAFPKLLMPADIDGDGWVSDFDVAKIQSCIDNNVYDPLCDINMDGIIDENDLSLVQANLNRGTPKKGVIWLPAISDTVPVEIT